MQVKRREGILVEPYQRLNKGQIEGIHRASMAILEEPGIISYSEEAADIFQRCGAKVSPVSRSPHKSWIIRIPQRLVLEAVEKAPSVVKLGARREENCLILDGEEPRVHFGTGSESNIWLEMSLETFVNKKDASQEIEVPVFHRRRGTALDLCHAARLCEHLENVDFFIRTVNIQDDDITESTKDVNKFYASLNHITKHVMAGLTELGQLQNVVRMAELIVGGRDKLRENPIISFITCVTKSPLQLVDDTTQKLIQIARYGLPVVVSTSPVGGATAPLEEGGMVAQLNAEILSGIVLSQLVREGTPVLYGSVPVRGRVDNLDNMYGAPEFNHYNVDGAQMARFYRLPCYSTAGISDVKIPGIQATVEKMFSHLFVALSGPQYVHYAFGLLEKTNTFSPEQAVLDDAHIGMVKFLLKRPKVSEAELRRSVADIREIMTTSHKLFARPARRLIHSGEVFLFYPFEGDEERDEVLINAHRRVKELLSLPVEHIPEEVNEVVLNSVPGILPRLNPYGKEGR
jgi:trimethylamine--corrinoid protein Co-methyltransferase